MSLTSPFMARLVRDYGRAGDLYYQQGRLSMAAQMYARAGYWGQAASLYEEIGDRQAALEAFTKDGNYLRSAELELAAGNSKQAIELFERANAFTQAAEVSLTLRQPSRGARYFERAGDLTRAADGFAEAGEHEEALRVLKRESNRLASTLRTRREPGIREKLKSAELKRAEILVMMGEIDAATEILLQQDALGLAGELFEKAGELERAFDAFQRAGKLDRAAALVDRVDGIPPERRARALLHASRAREAAALFMVAGLHADAAEAFDAAGSFSEAAASWEMAGEPQRAGELFYRIERYADAARCFQAAGQSTLAAQAFEKAGEITAAAAARLEAGEPYAAGLLYRQAGDQQAALKALQTIVPEGTSFRDATLLIAELLIEDRLPEGALHRLQMLPEDTTSTGSLMVEHLYWEARALQDLGRSSEAETRYERVLALRRDHRDVANRLLELRRVRSGTQPVATVAPRGKPKKSSGSEVSLNQGSVLAGRYEILSDIGRGGMARVFKARDLELKEVLAIKTLINQSDFASSDEERLLREVQICRRITHPNVVRVYDIGRFPGGLFITMELLDGKALDELISGARQLPLAEVRSIMAQTLAGLGAAHDLKIVHRDLKPSNLFLADKRLKILDFGIARVDDTDVRLTGTGEVMGSPMYMSPEQLVGERLDARSDLYSLGIVTFALLTGREPFQGKTPSAIALRHLQETPPDPRTFRADLPAAWADFVATLLCKKRQDRFASSEEVLAQLATLPETAD